MTLEDYRFRTPYLQMSRGRHSRCNLLVVDVAVDHDQSEVDRRHTCVVEVVIRSCFDLCLHATVGRVSVPDVWSYET